MVLTFVLNGGKYKGSGVKRLGQGEGEGGRGEQNKQETKNARSPKRSRS